MPSRDRVLLLAACLLAGGVARADWGVETVDGPGDVGLHARLALDAAGAPHAVYARGDDGSLSYALRGTSGWLLLPVDTESGPAAIAVDATGYPHMAYVAEPSMELRYAVWVGGIWWIEAVDQGAFMHGPSLALDDSLRPRIGYSAGSLGLRFAARGIGGWSLETVDGAPLAAAATSLALDATGHPHLAYRTASPAEVRYVRWDGNAWLPETVEPVGPADGGVSLVLDASGAPHLAYRAGGSDELRYAVGGAAGWTLHLPAPGTQVMEDPSLALDPASRPCVAYLDAATGQLMMTRREAAGWALRFVTDQSDPVGPCSLGISPLGAGRITYRSSLGQGLMCALETPGTPDPTVTPTPSFTATATCTPTCTTGPDTPTRTPPPPTKTPSGGPTPPTASPTASPGSPEYRLEMPDAHLSPGDLFRLSRACGGSPASLTVDEYILLDVYSDYWFWPGWTPELDWRSWSLAPAAWYDETILEFTWPPDAGSAEGIRFWGALLTAGSDDDLIVYDVLEWSYGL